MWLYLILFFIPVGGYFATLKGNNRNVLFLGGYLTLLALFVGLSDMLGGYDRYIYGEVFDSIANMTTHRENYALNGAFYYFPGEAGYTLINIIFSFFTENRYIFIFFYTLLIYLLLFISLKDYAKNYHLALILFMGLWFYFSFTYLRQVLGATVAWLSIRYIVKRDFIKFLLVFLVAWSIHKSAIIFFPIYFIPVKKFSKQFIIRFMLLVLIVGISPIPNALFSAYGDVSVVERAADYNASGGIRIAYLLESGFFLILLLSQYRYLTARKTDIVMFNIALLFCAILLFFIQSENGGRLSWYYMIGLIVTLTNLLTIGRNREIVSFMIIALCFFLYVRIYNDWQVFLNLYPYKTFLTNGFRKGDYSYDNYEYDHSYDKNKLYRVPFRCEINIVPKDNGIDNKQKHILE